MPSGHQTSTLTFVASSRWCEKAAHSLRTATWSLRRRSWWRPSTSGEGRLFPSCAIGRRVAVKRCDSKSSTAASLRSWRNSRSHVVTTRSGSRCSSRWSRRNRYASDGGHCSSSPSTGAVDRPMRCARTSGHARALDEVGLEPGPELVRLEQRVGARDNSLEHESTSLVGAVPANAPEVPRPSGTVTFLFTDLEGSTALWDAHPAVMQGALARHDEIVRSAIAAHGGFIFSTGGDGLGRGIPAIDRGCQRSGRCPASVASRTMA